MTDVTAGADDAARRAALFDEAAAAYGAALERLTHAYEAVPDRRADLLQEIYLALWQSLRRFDGRCALGTWVYRVAHNTATSICIRRRDRLRLVSLDDIDVPAPEASVPRALDDERARVRLLELVHRLKPLDRQIVLLYLEGLDAAAAGEIVGLSAVNVATKIHRLKKVLAQQWGGESGR
jgi:RNA polymerase sigma-70 factor (ECF subfamily)